MDVELSLIFSRTLLDEIEALRGTQESHQVELRKQLLLGNLDEHLKSGREEIYVDENGRIMIIEVLEKHGQAALAVGKLKRLYVAQSQTN